jgi:hypothetical protein
LLPPPPKEKKCDIQQPNSLKVVPQPQPKKQPTAKPLLSPAPTVNTKNTEEM